MEYRELDVDLGDGRTLHVYDTGGDDRLAVVWHHGTPNIGAPPEPLFAAADRLGHPLGVLRPARLRRLDAAARPLDRLGRRRRRGGGRRARDRPVRRDGPLRRRHPRPGLRRAAVRPGGRRRLDGRRSRRTTPTASTSSRGMIPSGVASLRAAVEGRAVKEHQSASADEYDPEFNDRRPGRARRAVGLARQRRRAGGRGRAGPADRRRPGLHGAVGLRPGRRHGAGAAPARHRRPDRPGQSRRVARRPPPRRRAAAHARRRPHLGRQGRRRRARLARRASGLSAAPRRCSRRSEAAVERRERVDERRAAVVGQDRGPMTAGGPSAV